MVFNLDLVDVPQPKATTQDGVSLEVADNQGKGISQALRNDLGQYRQQATKAALLDAPGVAMDILYFSLCSQVLGTEFYQGKSLLEAIFKGVDSATTRNDTDEGKAYEELGSSLAALDTEWLAIVEEGLRFDLDA